MSEARKRAYQLKDHNPNTYYYRFNDPGEAQGKDMEKDEIKQFLKRLKQLGANGQWGILQWVYLAVLDINVLLLSQISRKR